MMGEITGLNLSWKIQDNIRKILMLALKPTAHSNKYFCSTEKENYTAGLKEKSTKYIKKCTSANIAAQEVHTKHF